MRPDDDEDGPVPLYSMGPSAMSAMAGAEATGPRPFSHGRPMDLNVDDLPDKEPRVPPGRRTLRMPRHGGPHQALYDFLQEWRANCLERLEQADKQSDEWQRMTRFLHHDVNKQVSVVNYGNRRTGAGGQRFALTCSVPQKGFEQEVMALVERHFRERPEEVFELPAALKRRIRYQDVRLPLRGVTKVLHEAFWPEGRPSFEDIPARRNMAAEARRRGRNNERAQVNACANAGKHHGTRVHQQVEACVRWMFDSVDVSAFSFVKQRLPTGVDFCALRVLMYLDSVGCVPISPEHFVADHLTLMGTPIDLVCWQCEGFSEERRVGCHFIEMKTGYECGPFADMVPGDRTMQYLTGLFDTPYMRAVIQMVVACIFVAQRYDGYVTEEQSVLHVAPRAGCVTEYGMPGWVEDEKNAAFIYECLMPYIPVAHRVRVCSGMIVPRQFIGDSSPLATDMAATAAVAAGFADQQSADDWSFLSEEHLVGTAKQYEAAFDDEGDELFDDGLADEEDEDGEDDGRTSAPSVQPSPAFSTGSSRDNNINEYDYQDEDEDEVEEDEDDEDEDLLEEGLRQSSFARYSPPPPSTASRANTFNDTQSWQTTTLVS